MKAEELEHLYALLSSDGEIPGPSREKLIALVEEARSLAPLSDRKAERDAIIRAGVKVFGLGSTKSMAKRLAAESKKIHSGRKTCYSFVTMADRISPLPESVRRFEQILTQNSTIKAFLVLDENGIINHPH